MEIILWNETLITGIDLIDFQHKILVEKINELYIKIQEKTVSQKFLEKILKDLVAYTIYHFDTEEQFFHMFNYEKRKIHLSEHKYFKTQLTEFNEEFVKGNKKLDEALLIFLNEWLINHILHTDMEYVAELKKHM